MSAWIILLTVVLVTPEGQEDIQSSRKIDTLEHCESALVDWLSQDALALGGIGVAASCQKVQVPVEGENG